MVCDFLASQSCDQEREREKKKIRPRTYLMLNTTDCHAMIAQAGMVFHEYVSAAGLPSTATGSPVHLLSTAARKKVGIVWAFPKFQEPHPTPTTQCLPYPRDPRSAPNTSHLSYHSLFSWPIPRAVVSGLMRQRGSAQPTPHASAVTIDGASPKPKDANATEPGNAGPGSAAHASHAVQFAQHAAWMESPYFRSQVCGLPSACVWLTGSVPGTACAPLHILPSPVLRLPAAHPHRPAWTAFVVASLLLLCARHCEVQLRPLFPPRAPCRGS